MTIHFERVEAVVAELRELTPGDLVRIRDLVEAPETTPSGSRPDPAHQGS